MMELAIAVVLGLFALAILLMTVFAGVLAYIEISDFLERRRSPKRKEP